MGKDIHMVMEIKKNNEWEYIEDIINTFDCRNYELFNVLENFFGYRGIPEELKDKKFRYSTEYECYDFDFTDKELFHHSYVSLDELIDYYDKMNKVFVSEKFVELFIELGGVLPKGMTFDELKEGVYVEICDNEEFEFRKFIKKGIDEFLSIAKKYKVKEKDIRMIFAFDN